MVTQASPPRRTARSAAGTTARSSSRSRSDTKSRGVSSGRRVASTSAESGRQVADRAGLETARLADRAKGSGDQVARTARRQSSAVARRAADGAGEVRGTVRAQAAQVRDELATQGRTVVDEARTKVQEQSCTQARRAGEGLSRLAAEAHALAEGRPEEAETLRDYLTSGADRLMETADRFYGLADEIDERGIEGVVSDLQRFARRRPGVFLIGAAVAGFGVGRAVKSAQGGDEGPDEAWEGYDADDLDHEGAGRRAVAGRRSLAGRPGTYSGNGGGR